MIVICVVCAKTNSSLLLADRWLHKQLLLLYVLDSVGASQRKYTIRGLSPALYSLWMSASTAKGEGPSGQKIKFYIKGQQMFLKISLKFFFFLNYIEDHV